MPFRTIAGHRRLLELLARAVDRASLPPSLIFAGPDGVGKRTTAIALAQLLNCERLAPRPSNLAPRASNLEPPGFTDACGECRSCARIARGVHADVLAVEPGDTGTIKVDQVRGAIDMAGYRPFEGRRRVFIFDDADALMAEAQNALLKTLEEPPGASVFVLVTARPDVLLPTVLSRCQRLRFGPLAASDVAAVLMRDHGFGADAAHAAASASDGSVGHALDEGSEGFADARAAAARLLETAAASRDPRRRLAGAKVLSGGGAANRDELSRRLQALASLLRDLGLLFSQADARTLANADLEPALQQLRRGFDADRALRAFAAVDRALAALDRHASPKIVADWIAVQL